MKIRKLTAPKSPRPGEAYIYTYEKNQLYQLQMWAVAPQDIQIKQTITSYGRYRNDRNYTVIAFSLLTGALYAGFIHEIVILNDVYVSIRERLANDEVGSAHGVARADIYGW